MVSQDFQANNGQAPVEEVADPFMPTLEQLQQGEQSGRAGFVMHEVGPAEFFDMLHHFQQGEPTGPTNLATLAQNVPLAYGLDLNDDKIPQERRIELMDSAYSYIGVIPRPIDNYVGRWLTCLGCILANVTGDVTVRDAYGAEVVDPDTGEVKTRSMVWQQPLFKLDATDDVTGENVILMGGGAAGRRFAINMTDLFGPGDWMHPRRLFISQEARKSVDAKGKQEPHRLFRFLSRPFVKTVEGTAEQKQTTRNK